MKFNQILNIMKKRNLIVVMILLFFAGNSFAQQMFKEQIIDLSKKAATGTTYDLEATPSNVVVDDAKQQIDIIYTTKTKKKLIKFDVIQLDYDLNVINQFSDEQEVEKARTKYQWFAKRYRGDEYSVTGLRIGGITMNKLELVETSYSYGWFSGKYKAKEKVLKEVKSKSLFGKILYNPRFINWTNPETGNLIYINAVNNKTFGPEKYIINRINTNLEKTVVQEFEIGFFQRLLASNTITDGNGDMYAITADAGGKGVLKPKVNQSQTPARWTYLRFAQDGTLKEKIHFTTKVLNWDVAGATQEDGAVYIYGSGESKGVGTDHQKLLTIIGQGKQDVFQVVKISNGKVDFVSGPKLDEINAAAIKPSNQKKVLEYNGKKVEIRGINVTASGDVFINAQDFAIDGNTPVYKDLYMFHFAKDGSFKRFYGIKSSQDKSGLAGQLDAATNPRQYPTNGTIFEGTNGKLNWVMEVVEDVAKVVRTYSDQTITTWIPQRNLRVGQIDISSGQIDSFKVLGDGKYYLYNNLKPFSINGGKQTIYLGAGGKGRREMWAVKYDPTKG
jgi:hypothetical protein